MRRSWVRATGVAVVVAVGIAAAGCGSDDNSPSDGASSGGSSKGTPVKVFQIYQQGAGGLGQDYHRMNGAAQAAVVSINAQGGFAGHPVQLTSCDDGSAAEGSAKCAREAVKDKAWALVGSSSLFTPQIVPILGKAGIPWIGGWLNYQADSQDKDIYPIGSGNDLNFQAMMFAFKDIGRTKVAVAAADVAVATQLGEKALAAASKAGVQSAGMVKVPPTATDMSPYVQAVKDKGADAVLMITTRAQFTTFINAARTVHADLKFGLQSGGGFTRKDIAAVGDQAANIVGIGQWPPAAACGGSAACAQFKKDMDAAISSGKIDNMKSSSDVDADAFLGWVSMWTMKFFIDKHPEAVKSSAALKQALDQETAGVDVFDIYKWPPGAAGPKGYEHQPTAQVFFTKVENGAFTLAKPDPLDIYGALGLSAG